MNSTKINQQLDLEEEQLALGFTRYQRQLKGADVSEHRPGQELLRRAVPAFLSALEETLGAYREGRAGRGRPSLMVKHLAHFEPSVIAYITTRVALNEAIQQKRLSTVALSIATLLEEHKGYEQFQEEEPRLFEHFQRKLQKSTSGRHSRAVMKHASKLVEGVAMDLPWTEKEKLHVGLKLIELFIEHTGLVASRTVRRGKQTHTMLTVTPETLEWLDSAHAKAALMAPLFLPMVVPPEDWTNPINGGYLMPRKIKSRLLKVRKQATLDEYFNTDMPEVYDAVNSLQATPWRINGAVLDVLQTLVENEESLGGLPEGKEIPLPARPEGLPGFDVPLGKLTKDQRDMLRTWKAAAAQVYEANASEASKRAALAQQLWVAKKFREEEAIYFPYQLDFRGRIYAVPTLLNPQVDNVGKALLQFSKGKPLGETGGFWLAVHIANEFGFDKAPLEERVQWVVDNEEAILDSAMRPLDGQRFWTTADDGKNAWTALAACFEWAGFRLMGDDYVSHLPVAMDGSCSGLQHYSAMLRDPVGGEAVNLLPVTGEKADIYQRVSEAAEICLNDSQLADNPMAAAWRGKASRRVVKQPCMTFAYSATVFGMRSQIMAALTELEAKSQRTTGQPYIEADHFQAARFLAPIVLRCIREVVIAAAGAMDWLQQVVKMASEENQPIHWTSAAGLPVWQDRRKTRAEKVEVVFQGQRTHFYLSIDTSAVDARRQASSIAPNYVHSQDAAHLMKTVNASVERGITDFAMVHDSFGCHACDVDLLNLVIREEFIEMYREDRLAQFAAEVGDQLKGELPPLPPRGTLDLSQVADSDFFFA